MPLPSGQKSKLSKTDIIRLVKLLVRHGADPNDKFILSCVYGADGFGIFKELLGMNADMSEIALQIAVDMPSFAHENGAILKFDEAVNLKRRDLEKARNLGNFTARK